MRISQIKVTIKEIYKQHKNMQKTLYQILSAITKLNQLFSLKPNYYELHLNVF